MTGRLATLEEIVDWQPYDRVAWRLAVPGVGPVAATADLDPTENGTRLRLRWAYLGGLARGRDAVEQMRVDKEAAFARLATVIAGALPVVNQREVEHDHVRAEQMIDRSAMDVWAYAADIVRHPSGWVTSTDRPGRPTEVGARAHEDVKIGPRRQTVEFEVAEADPGAARLPRARRARCAASGDGPRAIGPESTRAVWAGSLGLTGLMRLLEPLFAARSGRVRPHELARLKERLEARAIRWPVSGSPALDIGATPRFADHMRIGELAERWASRRTRSASTNARAGCPGRVGGTTRTGTTGRRMSSTCA